MAANVQAANGEGAPQLGAEFDETARKLIAATRACSVSQTLLLRRRSLEDEGILKYASPNQLRVIFNVLLTRKIQRMESQDAADALNDNVEALLPPVDDRYTSEMREDDRVTLDYAFAQARISVIEELDAPKPNIAPVQSLPQVDSDFDAPTNAAQLFDRYGPELLLQAFRQKMDLISAPGQPKPFPMAVDFCESLEDRLLTPIAFLTLRPEVEGMSRAFSAHADNIAMDLAAIGSERQAREAVKAFMRGPGESELNTYMGGLATFIRDFPPQVEKAKQAIQKARQEERSKGKFSKFMNRGGDKSASLERAESYVAAWDGLAEDNGDRLNTGQTPMQDRDWATVAEVIEQLQPGRLEALYTAVRDEFFDADDNLRGASEEITDTLCGIFRKQDSSLLEIGLCFAKLIYREFPFDLDHLDQFFKNNSRYGADRVFDSFPYLRAALLWQMRTFADRLIDTASADDEAEFETVSAGYTNARRAVMVMNMRGYADQIATEMLKRFGQIDGLARAGHWSEKMNQFRPV